MSEDENLLIRIDILTGDNGAVVNQLRLTAPFIQMLTIPGVEELQGHIKELLRECLTNLEAVFEDSK